MTGAPEAEPPKGPTIAEIEAQLFTATATQADGMVSQMLAHMAESVVGPRRAILSGALYSCVRFWCAHRLDESEGAFTSQDLVAEFFKVIQTAAPQILGQVRALAEMSEKAEALQKQMAPPRPELPECPACGALPLQRHLDGCSVMKIKQATGVDEYVARERFLAEEADDGSAPGEEA